MDTGTAILLATILCLLGVFGILLLSFNNKNRLPPTDERCLKEKRLEFMKAMMMVVLSVWVLANLVGFWVVIFVDVTKLEEMLNFTEKLPLLAMGAYATKAGAENITKNKKSQPVEKANEEEFHE